MGWCGHLAGGGVNIAENLRATHQRTFSLQSTCQGSLPLETGLGRCRPPARLHESAPLWSDPPFQVRRKAALAWLAKNNR